MKHISLAGFAFLLLAFPFCASSAWREGFHGNDRLQLVGEGSADASLPQVQKNAMAKEAALMDAMSHWPRFCASLASDDGIARFRIENQKQRLVECEGARCRARIVIEKSRLRQSCSANS